MKVALVHDWLVGMRGGERVVEAFCELFPEADLFTLVHRRGACSPAIERMRIRTSALDRFPFAHQRYRSLLPLFPHAIEAFDLTGYDLVLSSSHCVAKGVVVPTSAVHVSYVHTPMRYLWDQYPEYFGPGRASLLTRAAMRVCSTFLRTWDEASANRVDVFVANSFNVASRVEKRYRREAEVVHPPVDVSRFQVRGPEAVEDFYLMVTAFAPYKKIEVALEAFRQSGRKLKVVGGGQEWKRMKALAGGTVELLGPLSDPEVADLYPRCKALIFPGEEDAGITPLEAQAAGRPVIALARGGALETVIGLGGPAAAAERQASMLFEPTGLFFDEPTVPSLLEALSRFEASRDRFDPAAARRNAERFDRRHFKARMVAIVDRAVKSRDLLLLRQPAGDAPTAVH
ncbi:MAG TPA: glycosyltransferase [Myxococcales bacterium]